LSLGLVPLLEVQRLLVQVCFAWILAPVPGAMWVVLFFVYYND
jgi:hypothetical protein